MHSKMKEQFFFGNLPFLCKNKIYRRNHCFFVLFAFSTIFYLANIKGTDTSKLLSITFQHLNISLKMSVGIKNTEFSV